MALKDVYNAVREKAQAYYRDSSEFPGGFEHFLTTSDQLANSFHGSPPSAIWVMPGVGEIQYNKTDIRKTGGRQRQIYTGVARVDIFLWLPDEGDQEQVKWSDFEQDSGYIQKYIQFIDDVVFGEEYELVSGGYVPGGGISIDKGFVFVLQLNFKFGVYKALPGSLVPRALDMEQELLTDGPE